MGYPNITTAGFFENTQWFALPEALVILENGLGSDRIRRIQYADIVSVAVGKTFPLVPVIATFAVAALLGWFLYMVDAHTIAWLLLFLPLLGIAMVILVFRKTHLVIESVGGRFKTAKIVLTRAKAAMFVDSVLESVAQAQGAPAFVRGTEDPFLNREDGIEEVEVVEGVEIEVEYP